MRVIEFNHDDSHVYMVYGRNPGSSTAGIIRCTDWLHIFVSG